MLPLIKKQFHIFALFFCSDVSVTRRNGGINATLLLNNSEKQAQDETIPLLVDESVKQPNYISFLCPGQGNSVTAKIESVLDSDSDMLPNPTPSSQIASIKEISENFLPYSNTATNSLQKFKAKSQRNEHHEFSNNLPKVIF